MNNRFLRFYVRTLPNGRAVQCPGNKSVLMSLYFRTILKLTGLTEPDARRRLEAGKCIRTDECEFWACGPFDHVVVYPDAERFL